MRPSSEVELMSLHQRIEYARHWIYDVALPFWGSVGVDAGWGFVELLDGRARPTQLPYKRLRVQARQVYVFSHAYATGYLPGLELAQQGWEFMCRHGRRQDGGWVRQIGRRGGVVDPTLDLYDQAFALLAAAWWARVSGDQSALDLADETLEIIDLRLAIPDAAGWFSQEGSAAALLQDPHMHLLEAVSALDDAAGGKKYLARIESILEIFNTALFDPITKTVAEQFGPTWKRPTRPGLRVMPGHHYEWSWLLRRAASKAWGADRWAEALFKFAERYGRDPETGLVYEHVFDDGSVTERTFRIWPNSEALKAHLVRFYMQRTIDTSKVSGLLGNLFKWFLFGPAEGTWVDRLDANLAPAVDTIPASSLYHLFSAIAELGPLEFALSDSNLPI
jgi:mannose/cellobiose epimerase-like protein (N-acyl-D-glucosamine 2-epimerase family)